MGPFRRPHLAVAWRAFGFLRPGGLHGLNRLVRAGRRLPDMMMDAPWTVAHVDRPNRARATAPSVLRLTETMKLAEQLGATTVMLSGDDIVDTVQGYHVCRPLPAGELAQWLKLARWHTDGTRAAAEDERAAEDAEPVLERAGHE